MKSFLGFIVLLATVVIYTNADDAAISPDAADRHLHESQIPPPYKQPSEEDVRGMLNKVLELMDKDGNQGANVEELKTWLDKVHNDLIADNVDQQWNFYNPPIQEVHTWDSYDPEKKQAFSWDHYVNATYTEEVITAYRDGVTNPDDIKSEDPNTKGYFIMLKRAEHRWKVADSNNDTVLVKEEFRLFLHPEEGELTKHILVEEAIDDMDADKNGEITLQEYLKHMSDVTPEEEKKDPNFLATQQSQFETYLDKNKDGVLDKSEMTEWLLPGYDRHESEASRMIMATDENNDQLLNKEELNKYHQYFMTLIPSSMWREFTGPASGAETTTAAPHDEF